MLDLIGYFLLGLFSLGGLAWIAMVIIFTAREVYEDYKYLSIKVLAKEAVYLVAIAAFFTGFGWLVSYLWKTYR